MNTNLIILLHEKKKLFYFREYEETLGQITFITFLVFNFFLDDDDNNKIKSIEQGMIFFRSTQNNH